VIQCSSLAKGNNARADLHVVGNGYSRKKSAFSRNFGKTDSGLKILISIFLLIFYYSYKQYKQNFVDMSAFPSKK